MTDHKPQIHFLLPPHSDFSGAIYATTFIKVMGHTQSD